MFVSAEEMGMANAIGRLRGRQRGLTLLEVLVAFVVLSVGLLGLLGIMVNGMKLTATSTNRAVATQHAHGMAETIRASIPAVASYFSPTASVDSGCFSSAGCSQPSLAGTEYDLWQKQLAGALPSGAGMICRSATMSGNPDGWACTAGAADPLVIKVCWDEARIGIKSANAAGIAYECIYTQI